MTRSADSPGRRWNAILLCLLVAVVSLSGCVAGAGRSVIPDRAGLAGLAAPERIGLSIQGSFTFWQRLEPIMESRALRLLGYIGRRVEKMNPASAVKAPFPVLTIYSDGWVDTPTTTSGFYIRAGRTLKSDDRVMLIWGSLVWRAEGNEIYNLPYTGEDTVWIRPYWPDPTYPTDDDLERVLCQPSGLLTRLAKMIGSIYGPQPLERASADPSARVREVAMEALGELKKGK